MLPVGQLLDLNNKNAVTLQPLSVSKNWSKILSGKKLSRVSSVSIALVINLHVICVMQIVLVIHPDTSINALPNTGIGLLVRTF